MRKKRLSYISGGFVALLLCLLTVTFTPRTPTANAQSLTPHIGSDLIDYIVPAGEYLNAGFALRDFPCVDEDSDNDCDHSDNFTSVTYRFDVLTRGPGGTNVDSCEGQGLNSVRTFSPAFYDPRRTLGPIPLRIDRSCENGPYTLLLTVTYIDNADQSHTLTDTVDFVVGDPNPNPNPKSDPPPSDPPQPQGPAAITQPRTLRARSGPGTEYDVVAVLPKGTWAKIVDIDPQAEWLQIEVVGLDEPVWVERDLTKVAGGSPVSISGTLPGDGPSSSPALASQP